MKKAIIAAILHLKYLTDAFKEVDVCSEVSVVDTPDGCAAVQRGLDRLERRATGVSKFSKGMCQVLHVGRNNPRHQRRQGTDRLENSSAAKDLEVLVDKRLNMSVQCTLATKQANSILAALRSCPAS